MSPLNPIAMLISLSGVSLVVFLVWLANRKAPPTTLGGEAGARAWIAHELLGFQVGKVAVDVSDRRAVATSANGEEVALMFVMGKRPTFWRLPIAKVGDWAVREAPDGKAKLEVATGDFTRPRLSFMFANKKQAEGVLPRLAGGHA